MTIKYYIKNVYGVEKEYILEDRQAKLVSALTHRTTINVSDRLALGELGIKFKEVLAPKKGKL